MSHDLEPSAPTRRRRRHNDAARGPRARRVGRRGRDLHDFWFRCGRRYEGINGPEAIAFRLEFIRGRRRHGFFRVRLVQKIKDRANKSEQNDDKKSCQRRATGCVDGTSRNTSFKPRKSL